MSKAILSTTKGGLLCAEVCNKRTEVQVILVDDEDKRVYFYFTIADMRDWLKTLAKEIR